MSNFRQYGQKEKQRWEQSREGEKKREDQVRERVRRKKMQVRKEGRKVAKHCVFPMIWGSGGSKSRLAKAVGAEPSGQMRDEKLHPIVARSTIPSQNVQNTPTSDRFLEVEMLKKCTPLWREAHFQAKSVKNWRPQTTFGSWDDEKVDAVADVARRCKKNARTTFGSWHVEKVHAIVARSTFRSQTCNKNDRCGALWTLRFRFAWQAQGILHVVKSEQKVRVL